MIKIWSRCSLYIIKAKAYTVYADCRLLQRVVFYFCSLHPPTKILIKLKRRDQAVNDIQMKTKKNLDKPSN